MRRRLQGFYWLLSITLLTTLSVGVSLTWAKDVKKVKAQEILISDTNGILQVYNTASDSVAQFHQFAFGGNFDIQFDGPSAIIIVNADFGFPGQKSLVSRFDLMTLQSQTIAEDGLLSRPLGIAVSRTGFLYISDFDGRVLSIDRRNNNAVTYRGQKAGRGG